MPTASSDGSDLDDVAATRLRTLKQRYTTARRALVEVLVEAEAPLTVAEIIEQDESLALSSAYRNLVVLEQAGVIHRIVTSDEYARYELAEDLTQHHHHLICSRCGAVRDFTISEDVEDALDRALRRVAKRNEFSAEHHRLDLVGVCANCQ